MKRPIDIDTWERKELFNFFSKFDEPFFGATVTIDCTQAYAAAKKAGQSFFLYYLYRALKAANQIENFRYLIKDGEVFLYDQVHASPTIDKPNGTFGFAFLTYFDEEAVFLEQAKLAIEKVRASPNLLPETFIENVIHCSAIPWLNFTSLSHARHYALPDCAPKISFGMVTEANGVRTMPVSIHGHHALMDGYHVGLFVEKFQRLMLGADGQDAGIGTVDLVSI